MSGDWTILSAELAFWADEGLELPFWWRDDDAINATPQLDQLLDLSKSTGVPVHVAVIPKGATGDLSARLANATQAVPIVHGYAHLNNEPAPAKKSEFGVHRNAKDACTELLQGAVQLRKLFGDRLAPMFAPPWNRISPVHYEVLLSAGYKALSTYTPRQSKFTFGNLEQINTHTDPIDWSGSRSLHDPDMLIDQVVKILQARRKGEQDNSEPLGFLTHHLVHDQMIWDYAAQFLQIITTGPVRLWTANQLRWETKNEPT